MNYTIQDMTMSRMVHKGGFALLDEDDKPVIQIYDFDKRQWVEGSFVLDTDTMEAKKEGGRKSVKVEADLDQGIWFAAP